MQLAAIGGRLKVGAERHVRHTHERLALDVPKMALTNEMSDEEKKRVMELGAAGYIVKATMIPSEVVTTIVEEIAKKKK